MSNKDRNSSLLGVIMNETWTESGCKDLISGRLVDLQEKDLLWPVVSLAILLQVTTVCLNITVIVKVNRRSQNKAQTRFLLTSMACVDLCVGLAIMTFNILNTVHGLQQTFGLVFCDVFNAMDVVLTSASVFHLTGLTVERYIAISYPFRYHKICNKKRLGTVYVSCWGILITTTCGMFVYGIHKSGLGSNMLSCLEQNRNACVFVVGKYFVTIGTALTIALPGILIVFFNIKLFGHVRTMSVKKRFLGRKNSRPSQESNSIRVAKTVVVLTGCFLVCWLPFTIINVTSTYGDTIPGLSDAFKVAIWLGYLNSAANPALYLIMQGNNCIGKGS